MAMVSADGSSQSFCGLTAQIGWFGLRVGGYPALSLHSSNELGELSQWLWQHHKHCPQYYYYYYNNYNVRLWQLYVLMCRSRCLRGNLSLWTVCLSWVGVCGTMLRQWTCYLPTWHCYTSLLHWAWLNSSLYLSSGGTASSALLRVLIGQLS